MRTYIRSLVLLLLAVSLAGCATLGAAIQAPRFEVVTDRPSELRVLLPSSERPFGGAAVRIWARVENPNPFGLTLAAVNGALFLEGRRSALVDFPLGLPLLAAQDTVIPLDIGISFADLPGMTEVATRALTGSPLAYRLDGRVRVDAGLLGQPVFGPMTLLQGSLQPLR